MPKNGASNDWVCPSCSAPVHKGDRFCRDCGVELNWSLSVQPNLQEPNRTKASVMDEYGEESSVESAAAETKESSFVPAIGAFLVIALTVFLFLAAGSMDDADNALMSGKANSQNESSEAKYYQERIAPHIVTGYAWSNFQSSSGITGGGSISDFSRELYGYLDGISPVSRSGIEASMDPGNGLSNLLYAIIDDQGIVDLIYTWLIDHAPA